jgi:Fe2+ transport system protein FeoA
MSCPKEADAIMDIETRNQRGRQVPITLPKSNAQVVPMKSLKAGQCGTVVDLVGSDCTIKCLVERGLRDGSRIKVIVPGASAVFQVGDLTLSLRTCGHCEVFVRPD